MYPQGYINPRLGTPVLEGFSKLTLLWECLLLSLNLLLAIVLPQAQRQGFSPCGPWPTSEARKNFWPASAWYYWKWVRFARRTSKTVALVAMKTKSEAGLMWKMTWSVHFNVLSLECLCFVTTSKLGLRIDCGARCIVKCCFCSCSMHMQ